MIRFNSDRVLGEVVDVMFRGAVGEVPATPLRVDDAGAEAPVDGKALGSTADE